ILPASARLTLYFTPTKRSYKRQKSAILSFVLSTATGSTFRPTSSKSFTRSSFGFSELINTPYCRGVKGGLTAITNRFKSPSSYATSRWPLSLSLVSLYVVSIAQSFQIIRIDLRLQYCTYLG